MIYRRLEGTRIRHLRGPRRVYNIGVFRIWKDKYENNEWFKMRIQRMRVESEV